MTIKKAFSVVIACSLIGLFPKIQVSDVRAETETEISVWDGSADTFWYNESEVEFNISTSEEFAGLAKLVNSGNSFKDKTIILNSDLDLNNLSWTPIGDINNYSFDGVFDGKNHTISKLYVSNFVHSGLFGSISEKSAIRNVVIDEQSSIKASGVAGGIVALANEKSLIEHCVNYGEVKAVSYGNSVFAGGIVGSGGVVNKCGNCGAVTADVINDIQPMAYAGGISGQKSNINECFNKGEVIAKSKSTNSASYERSSSSMAGGISASYSKIKNCYNQGDISAQTSKYANVGGILGGGESEFISNCYNVGSAQSGIISGNSTYSGKSYANFVDNSYYLNSSATRGIGNVENDVVGNPNEKTMKSKNFAKTLGRAYVYVEEDYPKLAWEVGINLGDINEDGTISIADAVTLQKFLLGDDPLANWKNADLCEDERIDAFDMVLLRILLIEGTIV